jgi:serine/threonine protein kinase
MAAPIKKGWLTKQGGVIKSWKRRWFVIDDNQNLHYYKTATDKATAGSVNLLGALAVRCDEETGQKNSFSVSGKNLSRTYYLFSDTEAEADDWVKIIREQSQKANTSTAQPGDADYTIPSGVTKVGLDDFDLLKVIGRGGFGKVMLVRKKGTQDLYAMKILSKDMLIKRNQVQRTHAENRILRKVEHPFLVGLKFGFQTESKLYLVMDYINGGDLFAHLQNRRRFTVDQTRLYAAEMVLAFEHLHREAIVYRDLKPENILMGADGHIRLTDFGLCKESMGADDTTSSFCGTPEYLAPEILSSTKYGKDVDWWSLGVLIYEMMIGRPPFYSENTNQMYEKILKDELRFPASIIIPEEAKSLLRQLLVRNPKERLGTGERDAAALKAHPFFATIDWDVIMRKEIDPPFKPEIKSATDVSNFDPTFTKEAAILTVIESTLADKDQAQFQGFTFAGESKLAGAED